VKKMHSFVGSKWILHSAKRAQVWFAYKILKHRPFRWRNLVYGRDVALVDEIA
jgi:hypothetical protein